MNTKLYVGNLSYDATETDLQDLFSECGPVKDVHILLDKMTGRARGFGFVTMETPEGMEAAVRKFDNFDWMGRKLKVNEARPREDRPAGGGGGGGGYGGGGGGYGGGGGGRGGDRRGGGGGERRGRY